MKPVLNEQFADNGEHSHWELIDPHSGIILWIEDEELISSLSPNDKTRRYRQKILMKK